MEEILRRHFAREEEFLKEFGAVASAAARFLAGAWRTDPGCDDRTRQRRHDFLRAGALENLVFESAAVYDDGHALSSVYIVLRSSKRVVSVHVRNIEGTLVAEKVLEAPA